MRTIKKIDFWISVILLAVITSIIFVKVCTHSLSLSFFTGYFIVGCWQAISIAIHAYNHWFTYDKGKRYIYHWIIALLLLSLPFGSTVILLFIAPFMAVYYAWICYEEAYVKMERPLALLK